MEIGEFNLAGRDKQAGRQATAGRQAGRQQSEKNIMETVTTKLEAGRQADRQVEGFCKGTITSEPSVDVILLMQ